MKKLTLLIINPDRPDASSRLTQQENILFIVLTASSRDNSFSNKRDL